jgi:ribulose-phosphate 3-epimerase
MTVEPGFGGQSFIMSSLDKVKELVELRRNNGLSFVIEVDGGVNFETAKLCKDQGVDIAVAGSYLFNMNDRKKGMEGLR